jgi:ubiquinone/menaquinone biosynthesis C-methylase UbiE
MNVKEQDQIQVAWDRIAAGYDEFVTPTHVWLGGEALRRVGLRPGMRFLDVAAGTGALSVPAARLGAEVLATDLSPAMVARLSARARAEGLTNLEARVMDGHALELDDDAFDVAGSQFGIMLFPDLPRAVRELVRVTKPGGHAVLVVYGAPSEIEFFQFFLAAMRTAVPGFSGPPMDPPPLPFQVADPAKLRGELIDAGLRAVRVETITEKLEFSSGRQLWDWLLNSNPISGMLVADVTEARKAVARQALDDMVRERADARGIAVLTSPVHIGVGSKPAG